MNALEKIKLSRESLKLVASLKASELLALDKIKASRRVLEITALLKGVAVQDDIPDPVEIYPVEIYKPYADAINAVIAAIDTALVETENVLAENAGTAVLLLSEIRNDYDNGEFTRTAKEEIAEKYGIDSGVMFERFTTAYPDLYQQFLDAYDRLDTEFKRVNALFTQKTPETQSSPITQFFIDIQQGNIEVSQDTVKQAYEYAQQDPDNTELVKASDYVWDTVTTMIS